MKIHTGSLWKNVITQYFSAKAANFLELHVDKILAQSHLSINTQLKMGLK